MPAALSPGQVVLRPEALVLDTNAVLDWLVFRDHAAQAVGTAIGCAELRWLMTPRMLAELRSVLARPLASRWEHARELALTIEVSTLATLCSEPPVAQRLPCRDAADQMFIDLAYAHRPSLLLTRDRELLRLRARAAGDSVRIQTAAAWLAARPPTRTTAAGQPGDRPGGCA
ncbi:MAG: hypothetical protein LKCHEGNO_02476 [Burkholderiaceae bacterium]|nr:hypothetical protein [Burkholderiaceae bacterium]